MTRRLLLEGPGCVCKDVPANLISMEWLVSNPSLLLWADSIVVSQRDYDYVCSGSFTLNDELLGITFALLFERLKNEGIFSTFDPERTIPKMSKESVRELVESDIYAFGTTPTESVGGKINPSVIETQSGSFCGVVLENIYTNLLASRLLGCSCLMDRSKAEFVSERFNQRISTNRDAPKAFSELYSVLIPELNPHKDYKLFCAPQVRSTCIHADDCEKQITGNVNSYIDAILLMRSKPAMQGLSALVERIESESCDASPSTIKETVLKDIAKAQNKLQSTFPLAKRWAKIVGKTSFAATSLALSFPATELIAPFTGAVALGSLAASEILDSKIASDSWKITFLDNYLSKNDSL